MATLLNFCGNLEKISNFLSLSSYGGTMIPITGLNYAVLFVRNLERSLDFYKTIFGFEDVDRTRGQMAFLRAVGFNNHHDLA